jgi:hypothetical protein
MASPLRHDRRGSTAAPTTGPPYGRDAKSRRATRCDQRAALAPPTAVRQIRERALTAWQLLDPPSGGGPACEPHVPSSPPSSCRCSVQWLPRHGSRRSRRSQRRRRRAVGSTGPRCLGIGRAARQCGDHAERGQVRPARGRRGPVRSTHASRRLCDAHGHGRARGGSERAGADPAGRDGDRAAPDHRGNAVAPARPRRLLRPP